MRQHNFLLAALGAGLIFMHSTASLAADSHSKKSLSLGSLPIQVGLSGLFSVGGSSADSDELAGLQAGGHDPRRNGFTVQNVELLLSSTVDNYFDAQANLIFLIDTEGETVVELEEAFLTTRGLPGGLQIKAGQFFTEFGRQNKQHPHTWAFVDQPVILSRLFGGDGLRSQGMRLAWLMPVDWYSELYIGAQNANGETVTSFLFTSGEAVGGHTLTDRSAKKFSDQLYSARWLNGLDLSNTVSMNVGVSALIGPNSSGADTNTAIHGVDLYLKWQPRQSRRGFPFVVWHSEFLQRDYEAPNETLKDSGGFTQLLWGFKPGWVAGLRYDFAHADGDTSADPLRDTRTRISPNMIRYLSEHSKLRLQYNYDKTEHLADNTNHSLWLQVKFNIGSHAAHTF